MILRTGKVSEKEEMIVGRKAIKRYQQRSV